VSDNPGSENAELQAAMAAVAENRTDETMVRLFGALGASRLLVPVQGRTREAVELAVVVDADGTTFHAFTDERALLAGLGAEAPYVTMDAPALAAAALSDPAGTVVVDAGSPAAGRLSRRDLELIRDRLVPGEAGSARAQPGGSLRLFGLSQAPADALLEALATAAASQPALQSLHLFEGSFGGGDRHAMVGVRFAGRPPEDEQRAALAALSNAARPHVARGDLLDVIGLSEEREEPVAAVGKLVWPRGS
jgi:SseB protein N-terminal domain/SseB protein C-terminal domain